MAHLYSTHPQTTRKNKLHHFSAKIWRSITLINRNSMHDYSEKRIYSRGSTVPITYWRSEIIVHSGKRWHSKYVNRWMFGFKFGEFTWNRKFAIYKAKQKRKKNKKLKNKAK